MRRLLAAAAALLVIALARRAAATGICDPVGHFCIQLDTTSARVCAPLRPGALATPDCEAVDAEVRASARRAALEGGGGALVVDAIVARFDEWQAMVNVIRAPARPEAAGSGDAAVFWDQLAARLRPAGWLAEPVQAPSLSRVHDVQVVRSEARLSSAGIGGVMKACLVGFEVRARDASYVVLFQSSEEHADRLRAFADQSMATLDALPMRNPTASGEGLAWLVRGVAVAGAIVGIAWWIGRRKGRRGGIDARDLWPR
jgi:hypothetical protein